MEFENFTPADILRSLLVPLLLICVIFVLHNSVSSGMKSAVADIIEAEVTCDLNDAGIFAFEETMQDSSDEEELNENTIRDEFYGYLEMQGYLRHLTNPEEVGALEILIKGGIVHYWVFLTMNIEDTQISLDVKIEIPKNGVREFHHVVTPESSQVSVKELLGI